MSRYPLFSVEVRALAAVLALASILILAVAASAIGAFIMKRTVAIAALGGLAIVLSGCNTTTSTKLLDNLQGCTRHYDGTVSAGMTGGQFSGTIKVDCVPPTVAAAAPPTP